MIKLCIFDLDGTLLNTLEDLADAANHVLAKHHFPTHPVDAYRYFVGNGMPTLIRRILPPEHRDSEVYQVCFNERIRTEDPRFRMGLAHTRFYGRIPSASLFPLIL